MGYISLSDKDKKEMLARIGISSVDDLFRPIPEDLRLKQKLDVPGPLSEPELMDHFRDIAKRNTYHRYVSFLGGGAYPHFIPAVVDYLSSRGEFVTPYTPYQPEVSQGTLQAIFEFQTLICQLTGMDIANASLYDGASGAAEAVLMAFRQKNRAKVLVSRALNPQYREVIQTYSRNLELSVEEVAFSDQGTTDIRDLRGRMDGRTSAVVVQSPNFFGLIEGLEEISRVARENGALLVVAISEPVSLGLLEPPGSQGADIVTGEGQSFGLPLSFGGPYLGFMACRREFVRQFPGRIAGETKDVDGNRGFVLTLSTREQHIRRERATSNICTNQALCALQATIFLELLGKHGLRELAWQNLQKARFAFDQLTKIPGIRARFASPFFNEFVLEFPKPWVEVDVGLRERGIIGGLNLGPLYPELEGCALFCVTETHKREEIDRLVAAVEEIFG